MKIGIDPTGGTNWSSGSIVWSADKSVYDNWDLFQVEATAQGDFVTVFVYSSPLYPAPVVNVYWDDAALVVISGGDPPPEEEPSDPPPADNPPASTGGGIGSIATQPPRDDGSQWHVVQSGETLGGIAVAYNTTAQNIRDLNSLTSDVVWVGQELLIKPAGESEPEPQPDEAVEEEQPPAVAEEPVEQLGAICMLLFEDLNQNGLRDPEEALLANGTMNLSGVMSDSYTTDGISEPHCFSELESGDYVASAIPPMGYRLTGLAELPVTITGGGQIALNFGAVSGEETTTGDAETLEEETASRSSNGSPARTILIIAGIVVVVALAVGGGLAAYFLIYKRKATI
jgi:hypothetical protein